MLNTNKKNIVLCAHKKPDGDAIGALIALKDIFDNQGKNVYIVSDYKDNKSPDGVFSINNKVSKQLESECVSTEVIPGDSHLFLIDHSHRNYSLCKYWNSDAFSRITLIDHHFEERYNKYENVKIYRDTSKCACCELIYDWIVENKQTHLINKKVAYGLALGLVSDTMGFRYGFSKERIKKLYELFYVYDAEGFDKVPIWNKGISYLALRQIDGLLRRCSTKFSDIQTIRVTLNNKDYEFYITSTQYRNITLLTENLMITKFTKAIILKYESNAGFGTLRFVTNVNGLAKFIYEHELDAFTEFGFCMNGLSKERIDEYEMKLRKLIKEFRKQNPKVFERPEE